MKKFLLSIMCLCTMLFAFADTYDSGLLGQTGKLWSEWGDQQINGITWNASGEFQAGSYFGYDSQTTKKGTAFGSGNNPVKTMTIKTSEIPGTITSVKVNTSGASSVVADLTVTVGGVQYGEKVALTKTATDYAFEGTASGEIALNYTVESKAIYLKQIVVEYTPVQKNVAAPTSTLAEGTYADVQTVELACETEGATIYYTLDGNNPTKESTEYTGAFQIAKNCTLKAIAYNGEDDSNVASFNYTFALPTPVFAVAGGVYTEAFSCEITCTDADGNGFSNTKLYYTLDGTDPTSESDRLWGAHYVSETCNVKAVAVRTVAVGEESIEICSPVASESYIIANLAYYKKATEIADGKYLMCAADQVAVPLDGNYGYINAVNVPANENGVISTADYYELTFASVEGGYTIQDSKGRYYYMTGTYNSFNVSADRQTDGSDVWTVAIAEDGTATITNTVKNKYVQYSTNYTSYGAYASEQNNAVMPVLYAAYPTPEMVVTPVGPTTEMELYGEMMTVFTEITAFSVKCETGIKLAGLAEGEGAVNLYSMAVEEFPEFTFETISENEIHIKFATPLNVEGSYMINITAGYFILDTKGAMAKSADFFSQYMVVDTTPSTLDIYPTGGECYELSRFEAIGNKTIQPGWNYMPALYKGEYTADGSTKVADVCDMLYEEWYGDNQWYFVLVEPGGTWSDYELKTITEPGTYVLHVPAGTFNFGQMGMTRNEEMFITYEVVEPTPLVIVNTNPVDGASVDSFRSMWIEFNKEYKYNDEAVITAVNVNDATVSYNGYPLFYEDWDELYNQATLEFDEEFAPGTYEITIPAGTFWEAGYEANALPETKLTVTVNEPAGIDSVVADNGVYVVYNLQGVKLMETENVEDLNNLSDGLYIINNSKVVIRK